MEISCHMPPPFILFCSFSLWEDLGLKGTFRSSRGKKSGTGLPFQIIPHISMSCLGEFSVDVN